MNISNALFEFTAQTVAQAQPSSPLYGKQIHPDVYEEIKGDTIRIDDIRQAQPALTPDRKIRKDNAFINVIFVAFPVSQKLADRLDARERAEAMADEWLLAMFDNPKLADTDGVPRICIVGQVSQFNDWIRPATVKMPVCVLRIQVNPRK